MMKIHTTQNLKLLSNNISANKKNIPQNGNIEEKTFINYHSTLSNTRSVVFAAKKPNSNDTKKLAKTVKKIVEDMKKEAKPEVRREDKVLKSPLFNWALKVVQNEAVAQASVAAVACAARAATLWGMSNEKNKDNNSYAIAHALASGAVGFVTVFLLTTPFKAGADHVLKKMYSNLREKTLLRLHPHLDRKSLKNAKGLRETNMDLWKNVNDGLKFDKEVKNCDMLPKARQLADMSIESFEKYLGVENVDWLAQKGKSFNDVVTRDGKKLYDIIDFNKLGIKVSHNEVSAKTGKEFTTEGQILFQDINEAYLKELIEKADENSLLKNLDINSVFKDGKMQDFRTWKEIGTGKEWKLDLDRVHAVSPLETADYSLRITGEMSFDAGEGIHKFVTHQRNGADPVKPTDIRGLGSKITDEMKIADKESAGLIKSLVWAPDIFFRIPVALTTVSLIPAILKNLFNLEKKKNVETNVEKNNINQAENLNNKNNKEKEQQVSFKGGKPQKGFFDKITDVIGEFMANLYGKPLIESELVAKISKKLSNIPGGLTQAMTVGGSLLTSSAYMYGTLTNDKLDPEKRKTLSINQLLCFIVPTIAGYTVDNVINNWVKKKEYRYSGNRQAEAAEQLLKGNIKKSKDVLSDLSHKVKGFRSLASVTVFALIYRYFTPVAITPVANRIGDRLNERAKANKEIK